MPKTNKAAHFQILSKMPKQPTVPPMPALNPKPQSSIFILGNYVATEPYQKNEDSPLTIPAAVIKGLRFWQGKLKAEDLKNHGEFDVEYDHTDKINKIQEAIDILQKIGGE